MKIRLLAVLTGYACTCFAQESMHDHRQMMAVKPVVIVRCTQGSFIEAINTVNAGVKALEHLHRMETGRNPRHAEVAKAEVGSIIGIALGRVSAEAACTKGLEASFKESYRLVLTRAKLQAMAGSLGDGGVKKADAALSALSAIPATKLANPAAK
jgi:hypothetical protein